MKTRYGAVIAFFHAELFSEWQGGHRTCRVKTGTPDSYRLPEVGNELDVNETAWRLKKNGREVAVRAPLEGTVIGVGGPNQGWYLKLRPHLDLREPKTLRHLLHGPEVYGGFAHEIERLQLQLRAADPVPTLADGGTLMPDLMNAIPAADWTTVLADTFLET